MSINNGICEQFPISNEEYLDLEKEFANLCRYAAWQLIKKNIKNNHTDEFDDINQELLMAIIRAGSYYKRQVYIEQCLVKSIQYIGGPKAYKVLKFIVKKAKPDDCIRKEAKEALRQIIDIKYDPKNDFLIFVLQELFILWHNRTRHGANKQKFGCFQEKLLENIVKKVVPFEKRPNKQQPLKIDNKFSTYCKSIAWNSQKSMGKKITREKSIRTGIVSISDYDYLATS